MVKPFEVGDSFSKDFKLEQSVVSCFSELTGDKNPIHLDYNYAKATQFKRPIAHGVLVGSSFSNIFGNDFPGPGSIYLKQDFKFLAPVYTDDTFTSTVTIKELLTEKRQVVFETKSVVAGKTVLIGSAIILYQGEDRWLF